MVEVLSMYGYGPLKPVKAILRRGMGKRENNRGDELNKVQYVYLWKYYHETPSKAIIH
jgi:hypothetical protein